MKERKELAVGETDIDAVSALRETREEPFDPARHEIVVDPDTKLHSIYYKRRKVDRTVKRPIRREGTVLYSYGKDARPIVLIVRPREMIETRLKGRRKGHLISWRDLHAMLVRRDALAALRQRNAERAARRKTKRAERKARRE